MWLISFLLFQDLTIFFSLLMNENVKFNENFFNVMKTECLKL